MGIYGMGCVPAGEAGTPWWCLVASIKGAQTQTSASAVRSSSPSSCEMSSAAISLDGFGVVFGEAKLEEPRAPTAPPPRPIVFHAHAHSAAALRVVATDFHSLAWDRSLSVAELDDLRDDVGIGGSWPDFLEYFKSSLSSGEVKLLFTADEHHELPGLDRAKLVATKAKGLPRIAISLHRVTGSAVNDVIANFSLALYADYKTTHEHALREEERVSELMQSLSSEREKNEIMQQQLEALSFLDKRKTTKPNLVTDQVPSVCGVTRGSDQVIPVQQQTSVASPSKVPPAKSTKRVAPMSRRARVRGAWLQDTEENDDE